LSGRSDGAGGGKANRNWQVTRNFGNAVLILVGLGAPLENGILANGSCCL